MASLTERSDRGFAAMTAVAAFGLILGGKLLLISHAGSDLPLWDQWHAEGMAVYVPALEGRLSWREIVAPHNEHRIVWTRLLNGVLLMLNGQWDARLQMVVNAVLHAGIGVGLAWWLWRCSGGASPVPFMAGATLALAPPFGWENTLGGFQSQFYLAIGFAALAIGGLTLSTPRSLLWWAGVLAAFAGLFAMASGWFAPLALAGVSLTRLLRSPRRWREETPALAVSLAATAVGCLSFTRAPNPFPAGSLGEWAAAGARSLAWPWCRAPWLAPVMVLPWAAALVRWIRREPDGRRLRAVITLGGWAVAQAFALALARGRGGGPPASRYMDILSIGWLANGAALIRLGCSAGRFSKAWRGYLAVWAGLSLAGIAWQSCPHAVREIAIRRWLFHEQERRVRAFVETDQASVLAEAPFLHIPHPNARYLARCLRHPVLRSILPASVADPLPVSIEANDGFAEGACYPATPGRAGGRFWGSFTELQDRQTGRWVSAWMPPPARPFLRFELAGYVGQGRLSLRLEDQQGQLVADIRPLEPAREDWSACVVKAPWEVFRIVATDAETNACGWFAFRPPRPMAAGSVWAERAAAGGWVLLVAAAGLATAVGAWRIAVAPGPLKPSGPPPP